MKAKAAVFMGANKDFEVREFEVTKPPKGYGQMDLIASGIQTDMTADERRLLAEAERYVRQIAELEGNEAMADVLEARRRGLDEVLKQLQPVLERERIRIDMQRRERVLRANEMMLENMTL